MNLAAYAADVDTADIEYIKDQKSPLRDFFDAPMTAAGHAAHGHFFTGSTWSVNRPLQG